MKLDKKEKEQVFNLINELVKKIAGKNSDVITSLLFDKKNIDEFKLADKLKLTINQVRNILYKLLNYNILTSIRKKDKRKGWYIYFWTLETEKALLALKKIKQKEIDTLNSLIKNRLIKCYYSCPNECIELSAETALQNEFACPECGSLLQPSDEDKKVKEIETRMESMKKELQKIDTILEKIKPKVEVKEKKKIKIKKKVKKSKIKKKKITHKHVKKKKKTVKVKKKKVSKKKR